MEKEYIKDFEGWNTFKQALDKRIIDFEFGERQIWWCALGVNIGSEQDGKGAEFVRPILILRKINKHKLIAVSITTKINNSPDRIPIKISGKDCQILLQQIRTMSSKRLIRCIQKIKTNLFQKIIILLAKNILELALKYETPPEGGESRAPEVKV